MSIPTYIFGAGGLGRGVAETIKVISNRDRNWKLIGFIDDNDDSIGKEVDGTAVVGNTEFLLNLKTVANVVIAIGNPHAKVKIHYKLAENPNLLYPNIIHPEVNLNPSVKIGIGNIISDNTAFSSQVKIGSFTLVHFNCTIGHDVQVEDYVSIYPNASISGFSKLGMNSQIGTNASVLAEVTIGEGAFVGAGSMVNRDVLSNLTVVGAPAREIIK
ncbi:NeuD/PglB/VioB family sugar acetyltransferase [Planococcus shenhongbingii]|uniref:NeuD/PglB/VioB family sugar acetyltransferase n=1 Tax=Planococcus shenhongbingii TaxID=3058398 RepID=UPI002636A0B1|nr:NeuD/PglB/VioB family sugar acetyltransferase [Planococcus sp. N016]WKA57812.1 NeuD/PglB/VioB family sugar acetyltransferase [Planococcus sp. N016]